MCGKNGNGIVFAAKHSDKQTRIEEPKYLSRQSSVISSAGQEPKTLSVYPLPNFLKQLTILHRGRSHPRNNLDL